MRKNEEVSVIAEELNVLENMGPVFPSHVISRALDIMVEAAELEITGTINDNLIAHYRNVIEWAKMPVQDIARMILDGKTFEDVKEMVGATKNGRLILMHGRSQVYPDGELVFPQMISVTKWKKRQLDEHKMKSTIDAEMKSIDEIQF